ncbi:mycothiol synthase [Nocardioides psychrotolerans]|uniref:mycothiol synthase n=1 Tax=Nocardioides psychrotolerans TaxID=1005945 RepID=UPI003137C02E
MSSLEQIAAAAEIVDGASAVDEATWRALRHHPERVRSWVEESGFALLIADEVTLVVSPEDRGRGVGRRLLTQVLHTHGEGRLLAWSHGDHPAAAALAAAHGFEKVRELWVMRRASSIVLPALSVPAGVVVRGYEERDVAEVLRVNAAAFAHHPEQGSMDAAELAERMAEPWFDTAGLLVAEGEDGSLLGFHWTKRHSPSLGEVYVVGIDPAEQGRGLGKHLTLAGLHHLVGIGVDQVLLYVESDNAPAVAIYGGLGFEHVGVDTHAQYARPPVAGIRRG